MVAVRVECSIQVGTFNRRVCPAPENPARTQRRLQHQAPIIIQPGTVPPVIQPVQKFCGKQHRGIILQTSLKITVCRIVLCVDPVKNGPGMNYRTFLQVIHCKQLIHFMIISGFVPVRPDHHTRMIMISRHQVIDDRNAYCGIRDRLMPVGPFADEQKAQLVARLQKGRGRRKVAAHHIRIHGFDRPRILPGLFRINRARRIGPEGVAVNPAHSNLFAIQIKSISLA